MELFGNTTTMINLNVSYENFNISDKNHDKVYNVIQNEDQNYVNTIDYNHNNNSSSNLSDIYIIDGLTFGEKLGNFLTLYYTPTLVCVGSIGNILSVMVFFKTKLRKLSSSYYLAALGISDTCFLIGLLVSWLNFVDVHIYNWNIFCQFFTYFSGLCSFLSVWFVVAFTVERFIAVLYPLKRQTMCTVRRAKLVLVGLVTLGCVISAPYLFYSAPKYSDKIKDYICDVREEYKVSKYIVCARILHQFRISNF